MTMRVIKKSNKYIPQWRNITGVKTWNDFPVDVYDDGPIHIHEYLSKNEAEKFTTEQLLIMNSLFLLEPTRSKYGIWSFDDETTGLVGEPFVGETNVLIDAMVLEKTDNLEGMFPIDMSIALIFGPTPFPGSQCELTLIETSPGGSTYRCDKFELDPWLCPALFKYFPQAPEKLYAMVQL